MNEKEELQSKIDDLNDTVIELQNELSSSKSKIASYEWKEDLRELIDGFKTSWVHFSECEFFQTYQKQTKYNNAHLMIPR